MAVSLANVPSKASVRTCSKAVSRGVGQFRLNRSEGMPRRPRRIQGSASDSGNDEGSPNFFETMTSRWRVVACHPGFDRATGFIIILNALFMFFEPVTARGAPPPAYSVYFNLAFTLELYIKCRAFGILGVLGSSWNWLDVFVVITGWLPFVLNDVGNFSALRVLRVFRLLRALRTPGTRRVIGALLNALPMVSNVAAIAGLCILVYAVIGMQLFGGTLHRRCFESPGPTAMLSNTGDDGMATLRLCRTTVDDCDAGHVCLPFAPNPANEAAHFDDFYAAAMAIFQAISLEGWSEQLYLYSQTGNYHAAVLFYVSLAVFGSFLLMNLFTAVIFEAFDMGEQSEADMEAQAEANMEAQAEADMEEQKAEAAPAMEGPGSEDAMAHTLPSGESPTGEATIAPASTVAPLTAPAHSSSGQDSREPSVHWLAWVDFAERVAHAPWFTRGVLGAIVLNSVTMCLPHAGESNLFFAEIELVNGAFVGLFICEMGVKLTVHGGTVFFESKWNTFDLIVTAASALELVMALVGGFQNAFLRSLRAGRVLRLMRLSESTRRFELMASFGAEHTLNTAGVLVLIIAIFALLGKELFGGRLADPPRTNFDDSLSALVSSFIVASGADWNEVYAETLPAAGVPSAVVALFFVSLLVLSNLVLLNLCIAIVCSAWDAACEQVDGPPSVTEELSRAVEMAKRRGVPMARQHAAAQKIQAHALLRLDRHRPWWRKSGVVRVRVVVTTSVFDSGVLLATVVSSLTLALESPPPEPGTRLAYTMQAINASFTFFFAAEMVLKMVGRACRARPSALSLPL